MAVQMSGRYCHGVVIRIFATVPVLLALLALVPIALIASVPGHRNARMNEAKLTTERA